MLERTTSRWWIFLVRGFVSIAAGIVALAIPDVTALTLGIIFAAYVFADGATATVAAIQLSHDRKPWGGMLVGGFLSLLFGALALAVPGLSLLALTFVIGVWAVSTGIAEIATAWHHRAAVENESLWIVAGVLSGGLGMVLVFEPPVAIGFIVYAVALYALAAGVSYVSFAFRLRSRRPRVVAVGR